MQTVHRRGFLTRLTAFLSPPLGFTGPRSLMARLGLVLSLGLSLGLCAIQVQAEPSQAVPEAAAETVFASTAESTAESIAVSITSAEVQDYAKPVRISGLLENKSEQTLAFKVSGLVKRVYVDEGEWVNKGQLLASLNLGEIDAQVAKARSVLANAERNLTRYQSLQGSNALSMDQLQQAETQLTVAQSDLTIAEFNRSHAQIRASAKGRILKRSIENNAVVQAGQPVFVFAANKTGWVLRVGITDKDVVRLQLGDEAELRFDAYPKQTFSATVSELAARADARSQTFEVELRLQATKSKLFAGFAGHGRIRPSITTPLVSLPLTSVLRAKGDRVEVYVLDTDNKPQLRTLALAFIEGANMLIRTGLSTGERVVVQGVPYITAGQPVAIHSAEPLVEHAADQAPNQNMAEQ